jgi:DNA-binding response OmpR family regulator
MDIDRDHYRVGWKGVWCDLNPGKEFLLIECLNRKPGKFYSPDELIAAAWDGELTETNTIQKWMSILRNHLEGAGVKGVIIRAKNKHYKLILT